MKKENNNNEEINPSEITRKQAIKKMGKYGALISLGTFMILNPKQAQAMSGSGGGSDSDSDDLGDDTPPPPPGFGD
ncbi:hypothetical protein N8261_02285 [Flavobacteriaceae bacterium]|mgnify:FL=1|jgi:hypothetical protein|nr:hypothetical protein [Flavobacteriaceae bacterium]